MTDTGTDGDRTTPAPRGHRALTRGWRPLATLLTLSLAGLGLVALPAAQAQQTSQVTAVAEADAASDQEPTAADQVLTWTADDDLDSYESAPVEAVAGPATLVFENSEATGNTTGMAHTLTFDVSNSEYNNDVRVNILANPNDANDGRHEVEVELTPGTYRYFCTIPGHLAMQGTLVVTEDGGGDPGDDDTTPPEVTAEVTGEQDADGAYVGGATVELTATDDDSGVAGIEYAVGATAFQPYEEPIVLSEPGSHRLTYRATDVAGNVSESQTTTIEVVEGEPGGGEDDTTPPQVASDVTIEVTPAAEPEGALTGMATVELTATDEESEVAGIEYALDGAEEFTAYTEPFMVHELGETTVTYRATDAAGNVSDDAQVTFTVVEAEAPAHH
ncbi:copper-binding protein [Streptomyces sp. 3MP-14]|uniref:Copper-binding protein n=1 Tax=Streptomyces mimosae TaxID=2586635 RepID=A0A5N6A431_9ACTN|nr:MULTISPECIES: plastocyanin/azurin family copper-binding protein [Streptomyces]KAB8162158.1 copper-binding protein [Streptomyces mimosae]KAB8173944.1 copper-binding protein [Streptomyces sp. 3MP-14]